MKRFLLSMCLVCAASFGGPAMADNASLELAQKTFKQADALAESGQMAKAKLRFESTLDILDRLRASTPGKIDVDGLRAHALLMKASVCVDLREKAEAKTLFEQAIAQFEDLARRDPKNPEWKKGGQVARQTLKDINKF